MVRWVALLVAGALAGCGASGRQCKTAYVAPAGPPRPFLWEVSGPAGRMVLFGTNHAAGASDVPAAAWAALDAADVFVAEVDEVGRFDRYQEGESWRKAFENPPGRSLMKMLPGDDFTELRWILDADPASLSRAKPWVALFLLVRRGFAFPHPNMPAALLERARARPMPSEFLESWEEQVMFLDMTIGPDHLLRAIRDYPNTGCRVDDEVAAYRAGDEARFTGEERAAAPAINARSERWAGKLDTYIAGDRRAFVAVGVSNLLGPHGVLARLEARGYTVRRVHGPMPPDAAVEARGLQHALGGQDL